MTTPGKHESAAQSTTWVPHPKVTAGAVASAVATLIVWGVSLAHVTVPPEVAGAITALVGFVVAYLIPADS
jgi:hypothetical protein